VCLTPGSLPALETCVAQGSIKKTLTANGDPVAGNGAEGGRSTDSTDDSGPLKPGNSVEDKTLKTEKEYPRLPKRASIG
jgi:hypothetical protein